MFCEWAEFAVGGVAGEADWALTGFDVGEPDGGRFEVGDLFEGFGVGDVLGELAGVFDWRVGAIHVGDGVGVAEESAFAEVEERVGGHPVALLIGDEDVACGVGGDAGGGAEAGAHGFELTIRGEAHGPAAPGFVFFAEAGHVDAGAHAGVESEPEVAVLVHGRAVGVFVVVAANAPAAGGGEVFVCDAVVVGIA